MQPFVLGLSKDMVDHGKPWFDKLTTNGSKPKPWFDKHCETAPRFAYKAGLSAQRLNRYGCSIYSENLLQGI
ncbi:hypothetical protein V8J88_00595 [Massilia sp. W12]|uniref:hypothetical protein n=1 Tax=Massilia sp. W12 TaxID=3126507 RepID=UPI0030D520AF